MTYQKIAFYLFLIFACQQGIAQDKFPFENQNIEDRINKYSRLHSERKALIDTKIPEFEGADILSGEAITDKEIQGKVTILNFNTSAYTRSAQFQHEELNYLYHKMDTSQVQIISIYSNDEKGIYKNLTIEERSFPIIHLDKNKVESLFKINTYPVNLIIDQDGIIRTILKSSSWDALEKEVAKLQMSGR